MYDQPSTSPTPAVYEVDLARRDEKVSKIWTDTAGLLPVGVTAITVADVSAGRTLIAYSKNDGLCSAYRVTEDLASPLAPASQNLNLGKGWDSLEAFFLADEPYLMAYQADAGHFAFFKLGAALSASSPFVFAHPRDPGLSVGFTTTKMLVCIGQIFFLGYNFASGNVVLYSLTATARSSGGGVPPLAAHHLWQRSWATGWTRFGFFTLGGEEFFLKTNAKHMAPGTQRLNVNIDHVQDDPTEGTAEVATALDLADAATLSLCITFTDTTGTPYFVAYKSSGEVVVYQIHADCRGWHAIATADVAANCTQIIPLGPAASPHLLFY